MALSKRKKIGWALLSLGAGGALLFVVALCLIRDVPSISEGIWLWPAFSTTVAVGAVFFLRHCYRHETAQTNRWFHFTLLDLSFSTILAGISVGLINALTDDTWLVGLCAPVGFTVLVLLLVGASLAGSHGLHGWWRCCYACAFAGITVGLLGIGGLVAVSIAGICYESWSFPFRICACVIGFDAKIDGFPRQAFLPTLRVALPFLPLGLLLRWITLRAGCEWEID